MDLDMGADSGEGIKNSSSQPHPSPKHSLSSFSILYKLIMLLLFDTVSIKSKNGMCGSL